MKGFLSFLGITLITVAFGSILLLFYGNPLEELKSQERQQAYQEMRTNHFAAADRHAISQLSAKNADDIFFMENGQSCSKVSFDQ
ncbi:hypothetical protein [Planomicrobium sp. Y74]|uniref:hypothetical protein n=1 Tax=Planomicrobium sp. Y74 TaxID=2478977 RepID=UPI000EF44FEF|nr:hypothetical protein [Planomicrobium sp. Y74]RLQ90816.1 hypothetical protein D9754_08440 [Planomicrobium sp. Y74]